MSTTNRAVESDTVFKALYRNDKLIRVILIIIVKMISTLPIPTFIFSTFIINELQEIARFRDFLK